MKVNSKMATNTLPAGADKFSGLSIDQALDLFKQIAVTVDLMADICRDKAEELGTHTAAQTFLALDVMLLGVGALADLPTGGSIKGPFADWMVGPGFSAEQEIKKASCVG